MEAVAGAPARTRVVTHPLRVLFVVPQARGGLARHVLGLVRHLDRDRFLPFVVCPREGSIYEAASEYGAEVSELPIEGSPLRCARLSLRLAALAKAKQINIVHAHGFQAGLVAAWSKRLNRSTRFVSTFHGFPPSQGWQTRRMLLAIDGAADSIIAVSQALRDEMRRLVPLKAPIIVIPNGIEVGDHATESATVEGGPLIGMIARLAPQKGIDVFIRAAHLVAQGDPSVRFVLVGEGPLRAEAELMAEELGLESRLEFAGHLPEVRSLLRRLALLVIASTSEGSSLAAMEAMAEAKPVVAAAAGGVPEVVADGVTGLLVPPGDPEALAQAMRTLLSDAERARQFGAASRDRVMREFRLELMVERTETLFEEVFAGR